MAGESEGKELRKLFAAFCLLQFGICPTAWTAVETANNENLKVEIKKIEKDLSQSRKRLLSGEKQKREILFKIFNLNKKIKKMAKEKGGLNNKIQASKSRTKDISRKIEALEKQIEKQRLSLSKALRTIYKIQGQGQLRVLFSSSSPQDLERNIRFLTIMTQKSYEQIKEYRQKITLLGQKKSDLRGVVKKLVSLKKKVDHKEKKLFSEQKKKANLINTIDKERNWYVKKIKEIRRRSQKVEISEESILGRSLFFEQKGRLHWPLQGRVVKNFGLYELGKHGSKINHKGILFASQKQGVEAVSAGETVFVDEVKGYGRVIILHHGDNYYSVYGNLEQTFVSQGDKVLVAQGIGNVSSSQEKGLYFEVRHYSQPLDPEKWLGDRTIKISSREIIKEG